MVVLKNLDILLSMAMTILTWADKDELKSLNKTKFGMLHVYNNEKTAVEFSNGRAVLIQIKIEPRKK